MTDRELLELAAKAYGAKMSDYTDRTPDHWIAERIAGSRSWLAWNPLEDDGDALRLAVKLGIGVEPFEVGCNITSVWTNDETFTHTEPHGNDPYAATRRAIVRAAYEIGKQERKG